jgi:alkylation response protein AidB-like acyl-CoA dehydrogenase
MDFSTDYTKEQEEFAQEVRAWLDENVPKDLVYIRDAQKMSYEQFQKHRDFSRTLGKKGWLFPSYPRQYGGGGLDGARSRVIREQLAERRLGLPPVQDWTILAAPALMACCTEEQKMRFLPRMLGGEALTWQLMTEPEAGTDEANQQTNALRHEREGEYFIVSGQKIFVGGLHPPPDQFYLLTRSSLEAPRHENLSSFICSADLPGITIQPLDLFPLSTFGAASGATGANTEAVKNSVFFDNVRIHESCLIGAEGDGWKVTQATFEVEHGGRSGGESRGSSGAAGTPRNHIAEKFLAQCRNNPKIVERLRENPRLVDSLVNIYVGSQIERLYGMRNAGGRGGVYGGPQSVLYAKMFGARFIADMAEILGPYALTDEGEWCLDEAIFEVGQRCGICLAPGGTPEAMKIIISRALAIGR